MSTFFLAFLLALTGSSAYAAGRMHGLLGYRSGYRQGHVDGVKEQFQAGVHALQDASRRNRGPVFARTGVARARVPVGAGVGRDGGAHRRG
ncbi:hypothetical protein O7627_03280 [Solwaraspora sp. WMMD1047]|uniref:hypothetical protein n=1 Tax=Solwaraspora sp. WMMD1047 TaxID=3016102 RepID=UPI00241710A4|nr:hypothetical protein [Solwaraspora sp. WMMD1047]MDG4828326.1 hypothetical protein [Solwaraspora sp. WMMD1047]